MKQCLFSHFILAGALLCLSACATVPQNPEQLAIYQQNNDPIEPYNRAITDFNFKVNRYVYRPIRKVYRFVFPEFARTGISNFSSNLTEPYILVNAVLQGEGDAAAQSFGRFFTNTTIGLGGLFDAATYFEIGKPEKDFGQTLYRWGWNSSMPYFVLPFLGPSDVRETFSLAVGWFLNPLDYALPRRERNQMRIARYAVQGVVTIDNLSGLLQNIEETSLDPYAALRSMYRQNRLKFLNQDDLDAQTQNYNFDFELDD